MLISNMVVYNEVEFVEAAIRSTINFVDKMIIIEGAWKEFLDGNPGTSKHSNDGTLEILKDLECEFPKKLLIHRYDAISQLKQRDEYFKLCPREAHVMLLQDADEVWTPEELGKIKVVAQNLPAMHCVRVQSLVFINDLEHVSQVEYPRLWSLPSTENLSREKYLDYHRFVEPNRIITGNQEYTQLPTSIRYFHYSYCHNTDRFQAKKNERTTLHGFFPWNLDNEDKIVRPDANIKKFVGQHPNVIFKYGRFANGN